MRRLSRPPPRPFYLWFHIQKTAPSFILWWPETEILFDPLRHSSPFIGLQRFKPIQMGHSLHIRGSGGGGGGLDTILMSMVIAQHSYCDNYRYFIVQKSVEVLLILKPFFASHVHCFEAHCSSDFSAHISERSDSELGQSSHPTFTI
jgi:hypothetical protein